MVITIDGPAGSGKSSVSKAFASRIGYKVLNTGMMYRALSWFLIKHNISVDQDDFQDIVDNVNIQFDQTRILINGDDPTDYLNTPEIDRYTSCYVSVQPKIREKMVLLQRQAVLGYDFVAEGRDMGSVVFPDAFLKFYLFASPEIRAQRRYLQMDDSRMSLQELCEQIKNRDKEDMERKISPLCIPNDAILVDTTELSFNEAVEFLVQAFQLAK